MSKIDVQIMQLNIRFPQSIGNQMNKDIPQANKLVAYNQLKRNWDIHQAKLKNIKPSVQSNNRTSNSKSKITLSSARKTNVSLQNYNRMMEIELQNRALLKKLTERQKQASTAQHTYRLIKNNRKQYYEEHSRRLQNQGLLKRIRNTKTSYGMKKCLEDRKDTQKYINLISKFQYKDLKPTKTILNFQMGSDTDTYSNQFGKMVDTSVLNKQNINNRKSMSSQQGSSPLKRGLKSKFKKQQSNFNSRQIQCDRIVQIVPIRRKTSDNRNIDIKAIQFEHRVVVQIAIQGENQSHCLQISKQVFNIKFKGKIRRMLNRVIYNDANDYFYIA